MATSYQLFWERVDRSAGPGGCWPWGGPVTAAGVAVFTVRGRRTTARRYAYRLQHGDPGPLRVVSTCDNPLCVNWAHLTCRSSREIALTNGSAAALNGSRTTCRRGHHLTPDNLYVHSDGRRECDTCKRLRARYGVSRDDS